VSTEPRTARQIAVVHVHIVSSLPGFRLVR
jgi:hypothetical protein